MPDHQPPEFWLLPDTSEGEPVPAEQLAEPTGRLGRTPKLIAALTVLALLVTGALVQVHRSQLAHSRARMAEAGHGRLPVATPNTGGMPSQQWPSASTGPCRGAGQLLPILSTRPLTETTRIRLQVGSDGLRDVDLDQGVVSATPLVTLREGSLVTDQRTVGTTRYLVVNSCEGGLRSLRLTAGQLPTTAVGNLAGSTLYGDAGNGVWVSTFPAGNTIGEARLQVSMVRLDKPGQFLLPANSFPISFHGNLVVCELAADSSRRTLIVYDVARHRIQRELGPVTTVTYSQGEVVWTSTPCSAASPCPLHRYDDATGTASVRGYSLPVEAGLDGGVLSPDHRRLAFQLPRMSSDPRYRTGISGTPSDLVVLDLVTGILEPVPNLELPPGTNVGMAFSTDNRWLVVGITDARGPRLLAWRSGLDKPLASAARLPGPVPDPLPFQVTAH